MGQVTPTQAAVVEDAMQEMDNLNVPYTIDSKGVFRWKDSKAKMSAHLLSIVEFNKNTFVQVLTTDTRRLTCCVCKGTIRTKTECYGKREADGVSWRYGHTWCISDSKFHNSHSPKDQGPTQTEQAH